VLSSKVQGSISIEAEFLQLLGICRWAILFYETAHMELGSSLMRVRHAQLGIMFGESCKYVAGWVLFRDGCMLLRDFGIEN